MELDLFLGMIFLLFWLLCEAVCIWLILRDVKKPPVPPLVYGASVGGVPARPGTPERPNFYSR